LLLLIAAGLLLIATGWISARPAVTPPSELSQAIDCYRGRDFKHAIPHLERALDSQPDSVKVRYLLGVSSFMVKDYEAAVTALAPLRALKGSDPDLLATLATAYGKLNRHPECDAVLAELARLGDAPRVRLLLGKAYLDLYDDTKARDALEKAVAADPRLPYAHLNLGVAYHRLGAVNQGMEQFDLEIAVNPAEPLTYEDRGLTALDLGQLKEAISSFEKGLALNPDMPLSIAGLGKASLRQGDADRAVAYFKRAIALDPENSSLHYQLGHAYLKSGHAAEAQAEIAAATKLQSSQAERKDMGISGMGTSKPMLAGKLPAPPVPDS
jgi:tetratricopeptide (TPR) repeat protein